MALNVKVNKVKCDIGSYIHYWRGVKKVGKTTLFYNLIQEQYNGDLSKGLLISIGNETGVNALDGLYYIEAPTWIDLNEIVDELVENREENNFEVIGLDTVDEIVSLAIQEVKRLNKIKTGKSAEFNACFGGYGAPRQKLTELVDELLAKLRKAGYGIILIGHTRIRDIKEKNGDEYQQLTSNLSSDYDGIFANKADIVATIVVEKDIDENKHINGTTRYIYFRSDGFVDAGGRFNEMPEKIEYGAKNYIQAFEEGVKNAIQSKVSDAEIKKRANAEKKEREMSAKEYAEALKNSGVNTSKNEELVAFVKSHFTKANEDTKKKVKEVMAKYGFKKFTDDDIPTIALEEIVELLKAE